MHCHAYYVFSVYRNLSNRHEDYVIPSVHET